MKKKTLLWVLLGIVLYVATAVPLGLLVYAVKNSWGFDVFRRSGVHAVKACLAEAYEREMTGKKKAP